MLIIFLKIFAVISAVFSLILIHEFGHFVAAKFFKVKVERFSIGFGKPFFKRVSKKSGTEFVVAPVFLGGYVKLLDGRESEIKKGEEKFAFDHKPIWQRAIILLSGVFANLLLAVFAFWLMFVVGLTLPKPVIGKVLPKSEAAIIQLKAGDEIVALNGEQTKSWQDVMLTMFRYLGDKKPLSLEIRRGGKFIFLPNSIRLDKLPIDSYSPDPLESLGVKPYHPLLPAIFGGVIKDSGADKAGLKKGDQILTISNHAVSNWDQFIEIVKANPSEKLNLTILRNEKVLNIEAKTSWRFGDSWQKEGYLGVKSIKANWPDDMMRKFHYDPFLAIVPAMSKSWNFLSFNFIILSKLVTGKVSLHILGGPLSILQSAVLALEQGVAIYFGFVALFSVMLCFVNILPIPLLDGGSLFLLLFEKVRRKPLAKRTELLLARLGIIALCVILIHATINDLIRIF